jgi:hypothetical protein
MIDNSQLVRNGTYVSSDDARKPKACRVWPWQAFPVHPEPLDNRRSVEPEDERQRDVAVVLVTMMADEGKGPFEGGGGQK